jgi:hypothetical protein
VVNSYETVPPQLTAQEAGRRYREGEFLRRNHHLISPWMYTAQQYEARNKALMLMHWDMASAKRYEHVTIPMSTLPPGNPLDARLSESFEDIHGVGYVP